MSIKTISYSVNLNGVTPSVEQFAGIQGEHRVTKLNFALSDDLYNSITSAASTGKAMHRFDVYDGEGGIWQSQEKTCKKTVSLELEERHTRFGGKITVYLVITILDSENKTNMELYSFPVKLKLQNRPEGIYKEGENLESVAGLCEITKDAANKTESLMSQVSDMVVQTKDYAISAEKSLNAVQEFSVAIEQKLENGDYDGLGVQKAEVVNGCLLLTYTDGTVENVGKVKGEKGDQGIQGPKGDAGPKGDNGKDAVVDQNFSKTSVNAQSGIAVAEALSSIKKDKNASGVSILIDDRNKTISDVLLTSNAPEGTLVKIYNKNYVGENELVGEVFQLGTEDFPNGVVYNTDSVGAVIADGSIVAADGTFTFKGTIQTPPEYAHYVSSELSIYIEGYGEYRIPIGALEIGDTYKFFVVTDVDHIRDKDGSVMEYIHTVKNIVLVNITKAITETVNADGTVNSSGINSFTLITHESEIPYDFELTYTVVDFATRKYVDDIVGDLETLLGGI